MQIELVDHKKCYTPELREIMGGTMVLYQNHFYIKLDKKKPGQGNHLNWPQNHSVLINPKYGSMRAVHACTKVQIVDQVNPLEMYIITDKYDCAKYIRRAL